MKPARSDASPTTVREGALGYPVLDRIGDNPLTANRTARLPTVTRAIRYLRQRPGLALVGAITVLSFLVLPFVWRTLATADIAGEFRYRDFGIYYATVDDWFAGEAIYDVDEPFGNYLYPPVYLIGIVPFYELFWWQEGGQVWAAASVGVLWLGLQWLCWTLIPGLRHVERVLLAPVLLVFIVTFHPIWYGMRLGQASIIVAGIVALGVASMVQAQSGRQVFDTISGVFTAIGGTVKLFYAPVGAHLLLDRRRFVAALGTGILLVAASIVIFGVDTFADYLRVVFGWGEDFGQDPGHPSWGWIPGYYRPLYHPGGMTLPGSDLPVSLLVRLATVVAVAGVALWVRHTDAARPVAALGIVAIPFVGPQVSTHDFAVLLPAIVLLLAIEIDRDGRPWLPVAALVLFHWQAYGTYALANAPEWLPLSSLLIEVSPLLQPGLIANVALLWLAAYRALEHRPPSWLSWAQN